MRMVRNVPILPLSLLTTCCVAALAELPAAPSLTGSGGCNHLTGLYAVSADTLTFSSTTTTLMACEGATMQQERAFVDALRATTGYRLTDDTLELTGRAGTLARFRTP